jgi:hypothetical protein
VSLLSAPFVVRGALEGKCHFDSPKNKRETPCGSYFRSPEASNAEDLHLPYVGVLISRFPQHSE